MFVTLSQKDLRPAVQAVQVIAGAGKISQPILTYLLLVADAMDRTLHLYISNGESSMHSRVPADVQAPGTVLLPAHLFAGLVQNVPASPITLVSPSPTDATAVQLRCQQIKANLKQGAMPTDEFPQVSLTAADQDLLMMDAELLHEVIEQIAFAAATDASRPALQGIRVSLENGRASFGAADAFRLAVRTIPIPDPACRAEVLIPAQPLRQLARLLPASGAVRLVLASAGNQVFFHTSALDLSTRLIEGRFPDFRSLLETQVGTQVILPTHALAAAVQLMAPFARENLIKHLLYVSVQHDQPGEAAGLVVRAEAPDLGVNEMWLTESVTIEGPALSLCVHGQWLAEALAAISTPLVRLSFTQATCPLTIRPVGPADQVSVIMPLVARPVPAHPSHPTPAARGASVPGMPH